MLFGVTLTPRAPVTEENQKRVIELFTNWTQPSGYEIKSHYVGADGRTFIIADASTAEAAVEAASPWEPYFEISITPVVEIAKGVPIAQKVYGWRDSVS